MFGRPDSSAIPGAKIWVIQKSRKTIITTVTKINYFFLNAISENNYYLYNCVCMCGDPLAVEIHTRI